MINVQNLTKYYKDFCAVDQINLKIKKGEILGLLGPNGAGKTTTLRMLTGFLKPTSGDIHVKDFTIEENSLEIKKLMGYLPESAPLYHEMLVYDYLTYIANIRELDTDQKNKRINDLVDLCGIREVMHRPIGELSKGYNQRVGLAHAMMNDPEILVLDEPTSGLDPNQRVEIREIIRRISKKKTIILSTHILSEAEATCNRIAIINKGKIIADDKTESLKKAASGEYFIHISLKNTSLQKIKDKLGSISGIVKIEKENSTNKIIHSKITCRTDQDLREDIYREIKKTDWTLLELYREAKTLENIFRELTKENE
ncbi:MAG: ATP-binding cassette domain-containing protein [Deltaproteobacteria bacterium]|nr:ATP-binding cassette domain-containing protein [Deltaproteobacteria bacterium]MBW1845659.1 ATP-binding cassette domain-containing protein [Deltaproteobacteria bacterium]MBW1983590.1 ATP-binding cassette domain-containing protein [Deltaproteobacteria bacterium]MBW2363848.1 ATP-binding cassette domain-containing protein [Deltaproteobacteria bacterium]